jgi:AcrR family transcriptional regulator
MLVADREKRDVRVEFEHDEGRVRRGRPRSAPTDARILDAALMEFADFGYEGLKFYRVAERAGVPRSTLYRRWTNKLVLAMAVVNDITERHRPANLGDPRNDFASALNDVVLSVNHGADGRCVAALAAAKLHNSQLAEHWAERLERPRREQIHALLQGGIERGDVREDLDIDTVIDLLVSVVPYHMLFNRESMPDDYGRRVIAVVMAGAAPTWGGNDEPDRDR